LQAAQNLRNNSTFVVRTMRSTGIPSGSEDWKLANILIVDDDPAVQITIRLLPEGTGHRVAGDGRKGLTLLAVDQFVSLFFDHAQPPMTALLRTGTGWVIPELARWPT
jgi:hypothetical protein